MISAPYALMVAIFSSEHLGEVVMTALYPLMAASMATAAPVLPELAATTVPPGLSRPASSALSKMFFTIRSFMEKPGLKNSHLPSTFTPATLGLAREVISTRGVEPKYPVSVSLTC